MRASIIAASLLATTLLSSSGMAQTTAPTRDTKANETVTLPAPHWRSSKLIGVNVYNEQNEKLGDINEVLLDPTGKVIGYVIGVGGFLGMGEHDIMVEPSKIKFVNEPMRSAATTGNPNAPTNTRNVSNTNTSMTTTRNAGDNWYPDHGVLSGATKDQLKAMPQFKYTAAAK